MDCNSSTTTLTHTQDFSVWQIFRRNIRHFLITLFMDVVVPLSIYFSLQIVIAPVYALIIAGLPPFLMVIIKAVRSHTFDALGFVVFLFFIISAIIGFATEDPVLLLLGQSFLSGSIGLVFAITLIPFHRCCQRIRIRPLAYYFYQDLAPISREQFGLPEAILLKSDDNEKLLSTKQESAQVCDWIYVKCVSFRRSCFIITIVWAVGLFFEFLGQLILIFTGLSINLMVFLGHIIPNSITVACVICMIILISKERKQTKVLIEQWKEKHLTTNEKIV